MPRLYVANATSQEQHFLWRVPANDPLTERAPGKLVESVIRIGTQVLIGGSRADWTPAQIDFIIGPHVKYGIRKSDEIDRTKPFIGLIYSIEKPVTTVHIERGLRHNQQVLVNQGKVIRQEAAVALDMDLEAGTGRPYRGNLRVEVEEMSRDPKDTTPQFHEGVVVTKEATPPKGSRRRRA